MGKKNNQSKEKKRQKKVMLKKRKDVRRHKSRSAAVTSENAIQHQMISTFGNVKNFIRTVQDLAVMFKTDEDLMQIRLDPVKVYEKVDLAQMREPLADMYSNDDLTYYDEKYEDDWKNVRKEALENALTDEIIEKVQQTFEKLTLTKKGHKKEYRAAMAGKLLVESHVTSLTEAPVNENGLWEILFNAAIKENKKELPAPVEKPAEAAEPVAKVEEPVKEEKPAAKTKKTATKKAATKKAAPKKAAPKKAAPKKAAPKKAAAKKAAPKKAASKKAAPKKAAAKKADKS